MNRHNLKKLLTAGFLVVSLVCAWNEAWSPASYFLFLAAFIDWTNKPSVG